MIPHDLHIAGILTEKFLSPDEIAQAEKQSLREEGMAGISPVPSYITEIVSLTVAAIDSDLDEVYWTARFGPMDPYWEYQAYVWLNQQVIFNWQGFGQKFELGRAETSLITKIIVKTPFL